MYKPSHLFERTPEEKRDIFKAWARDDQAFFANGACHILAEAFVQLHAHEGFTMVHIKPKTGFPGNHVYASDGIWAFDHAGWTKETELLETIDKANKAYRPGWEYERIVIKPSMTALEEFCKANNHRLPWQYAYLPWERAYTYIRKFPKQPPTD